MILIVSVVRSQWLKRYTPLFTLLDGNSLCLSSSAVKSNASQITIIIHSHSNLATHVTLIIKTKNADGSHSVRQRRPRPAGDCAYRSITPVIPAGTGRFTEADGSSRRVSVRRTREDLEYHLCVEAILQPQAAHLKGLASALLQRLVEPVVRMNHEHGSGIRTASPPCMADVRTH